MARHEDHQTSCPTRRTSEGPLSRPCPSGTFSERLAAGMPDRCRFSSNQLYRPSVQSIVGAAGTLRIDPSVRWLSIASIPGFLRLIVKTERCRAEPAIRSQAVSDPILRIPVHTHDFTALARQEPRTVLVPCGIRVAGIERYETSFPCRRNLPATAHCIEFHRTCP